MKRMLIAVAALGLVATASWADWGGPRRILSNPQGQAMPAQYADSNTLLGAGNPYNGIAPDKYGLNPRMKRFFRLDGNTPPSQYYPQMGYNQGGPAYNPTGYPPGAYGQSQGTLAFPHHPYVRSPRDFFMVETNR